MQANVPEDLAAKILDYEKTIGRSDLVDEGPEGQPHITVKYSLHPERQDEPVPLVDASSAYSLFVSCCKSPAAKSRMSDGCRT